MAILSKHVYTFKHGQAKHSHKCLVLRKNDIRAISGLRRKYLTTSLASSGHTTFATCVSTRVKEENMEDKYACAFGQDL